MKNIIRILLCCGLCGGMTACESYLDKQPDQPLTLEGVFQKKATTEQYLYNVFSFLPEDWDQGDKEGWSPASDEAAFSFNRAYRNINNGSWNPSNVPYAKWDFYYQGIREANIFLANVDKCDELTPKEKLIYKAETRFLRSFYYFLMMRQYGPVIIVGDQIIPHKDYTYNVPRNTWSECVNYLEQELIEVARDLPLEPVSDNMYGKPTLGAALALKARLLLYNASPLYNPRPGEDYIYKNVKNPDGTPLFPQQYDASKWEKAMKASREVINSGYELCKDADVYKALRNIYFEKWNKELIFARSIQTNWWYLHCTPRQLKGYGGYGVTQNHVDAYGVKSSGRYPITGYDKEGYPQIDVQSGYKTNEFAFSEGENPNDGRSYRMPNMYTDRDPRFYMNVTWAGMEMSLKNNKFETVEFYYNSNSGPGKSHDYAPGGYLIRKINRKDSDPFNGDWGGTNLTWSYFRLAEFYLSYAEALNEYDPGNPDILKYVNEVRERAGMKKLETAYPELNLTASSSQADMRNFIKRERQIELAFENGHRYFDTRRWLDGESQGGKMYGMNVFAMNQKEGGSFWKRIVVDTRVFETRCYLFPMSQRELDRNNVLTQNLGW